MTINLFQQDDPETIDLEQYIGEGGKFYDPDKEVMLQKVTKAKAESDFHIRRVEKEKAQLYEDFVKEREMNMTRAKLEELEQRIADRLSNSERPSSSDLPNANEDRKLPQYDPSKIDEMLNEKLTQREMTKKFEENARLVKDKIVERYGSNYHNALKSQIDTLGITEEEFNAMAARSPKVLIKSLGLDQATKTENFQTPFTSNQRSENFAPSGKKRNWAYYEDMRKTKPELYHNPRTLVQMDKDAQDQKAAFYN